MYTIDDLRNGKCAVINDGTLEELREVLKLAFPNDKSIITGSCDFYYKGNQIEWHADNDNNLPTQSVKDFLKKENMSINKLEIELKQNKEKLAELEKELEKLNNDPFDVYKPVQISRRDLIFAMALNGLLSNDYTDQTHLEIVKEAMKYTDKSIAELDKPRK
jgi:hypothetical protein